MIGPAVCCDGLKEAKSVWPVFSLVALTGLNLLDYLDRQVLAAVLTPLKDELHLGDEQLGTIATAFMLGYFLTSPIFGYLGDRLPRKHLSLVLFGKPQPPLPLSQNRTRHHAVHPNIVLTQRMS